MAIAKEIYKFERIVPVRFSRLVDPANVATTSGPPRGDSPDLDDRGFFQTVHGPIVGMTENSWVKVRLSRENVENGVSLFVASSDTNVVTVETSRGTAELPNDEHMWVKLTAPADSGGDPATAIVEVRFNAADGPVIAELFVYVFEPVSVDITPHVVTISRAAAGPAAAVPGTVPGANIAAVMDMVSAIWRPCGVTFNVQPTENDAVDFGTANIVSDNPWPGEVDTLLGTNWIADTINVYFVRQIGTGNTLGYGISRDSARRFHLTNPGVILGETTAGGTTRDTQYWANDLAHELGHFFQLWHPGNRQGADTWQDSWSRRMLMHNFNRTLGANPPSPRFTDAGYGTFGTGTNRGCMITIKNYRRHATDGECATSRTTISSAAGPY